ncbi:MAG: hypothetical protein M1825_003548 [Sarcosagium campestre]|nr:MAG: hypothetical protein M1825_003548 [Sarcosagium campestre]
MSFQSTAATSPLSLPTPPPPPPPPKPAGHPPSKVATPVDNGYARSLLLPSGNEHPTNRALHHLGEDSSRRSDFEDMTNSLHPVDPLKSASFRDSANTEPYQARSQDPGEAYIPDILQDKSKPDLTEALRTPAILDALSTAPSVNPQTSPLPALLAVNIDLARQLQNQEEHLQRLRTGTQAHLLQLHSQERSFRAQQARMDEVLAPFSPKGLYERLVASVAEQESLCSALEDSFLEGDGKASEREVESWVKSVREGRARWWRRQEVRARWDEGRVGGWR